MKPGTRLIDTRTGEIVHYAGERIDGKITVKLPGCSVTCGKPANYVRLTTRGTVPLKTGPKPHTHDPAIVAHWMEHLGLSRRHVVNELNAIRREGAA